MQVAVNGYKSIGLMFDINNDRLLSALIIGLAMAAVGWIGVEYAQSFIAHNAPLVTSTFL